MAFTVSSSVGQTFVILDIQILILKIFQHICEFRRGRIDYFSTPPPLEQIEEFSGDGE